jgi:hypothetical protein
LLEEEFFERADGCAPKDFAAVNVLAPDAAWSLTLVRLRRACRADSDLAADQALGADGGAAGNARLRRNDGVLADLLRRNLAESRVTGGE